MLKKTIIFLLLFLLAFSVFVLAKAPARVVWEEILRPNASVQGALRAAGLLVKGVEGTIWDGRVLIQYQGVSSIVGWDIQLSSLYSLKLPVELSVESQAGEIGAKLMASLSEIELSIPKGDVDLSQLTPALRKQRVTLDGSLLLKDVRIIVRDQKISSASGMMSWSGGDIAYPAQRSIHQRTLPSFRGVVATSADGQINAGIRDSGGSFDLIEATMNSQGEALVKVKRRLLDLAEEHWPQNSSEQDVVFKVKKIIY